ncbi:hypothetical protein [Actinopolyspora erythraea]|uniref:hypothetical protein n=1 Tax=Actinopolyspora erythraea TaxID=414996 RepID=UPI0018E000A6|nr:hypothetical protein [Actinopolyspora erythraea]
MTVESDGSARVGGAGLDRDRLAAGAGWGVAATVLMSVVMLFGTATGLAPMPSPVPLALVARTVGALPQPALMGLAVLVHLSYGPWPRQCWPGWFAGCRWGSRWGTARCCGL